MAKPLHSNQMTRDEAVRLLVVLRVLSYVATFLAGLSSGLFWVATTGDSVAERPDIVLHTSYPARP